LLPGEGALITIGVRSPRVGDVVCQVTGYSPAVPPTSAGVGARLVVPAVDTPEIRFERSGNRLTLDWPAVATDFVLESSDSLGEPGWTGVKGNPTVVNERAQVVVKVSGSMRFYRLRRP